MATVRYRASPKQEVAVGATDVEAAVGAVGIVGEDVASHIAKLVYRGARSRSKTRRSLKMIAMLQMRMMMMMMKTTEVVMRTKMMVVKSRAVRRRKMRIKTMML